MKNHIRKFFNREFTPAKAGREANMTKRKEEQKNIIGEKLSRSCNDRGLSFYMLARNAGVPLTTLMHIIDGTTKNPGIYTVVRICNALDVSMDELFEEINAV